ncbi:hypothetical protein CJI59_15055 [Streptomyces sp. Alain-F2R5]|nr:hypothetical protein CJI59_15055 [Streptomyces sp. Alain-F2R5]
MAEVRGGLRRHTRADSGVCTYHFGGLSQAEDRTAVVLRSGIVFVRAGRGWSHCLTGSVGVWFQEGGGLLLPGGGGHHLMDMGIRPDRLRRAEAKLVIPGEGL